MTPGKGQRQPWSLVPHRFHSFLAALRPSFSERQAAFAAARAVNGLLRRRFPDTARPMTDALAPLIIGSHAKDTAIAGSATIDMVFPLPPRSVPAVLDGMTAVLAARFGAVGFDRRGALTVAVNAPAGPLTVRVLPVNATAEGTYRRLLAGSGAAWLDPRGELRALSHVDQRTGGKARDLVRMLKAWREANALSLPSAVIEHLVLAFLSVWIYRQRSLLFYDWMVRDFFFWLAAQEGEDGAIAGLSLALSMSAGWRAAAAAAHERAAAAADLERDGEAEAALAAWRRLFGHRFGASLQPKAIASLPNGFSVSKAANAAGT
jgi:hypothetical protein